MPAVQGQPPTDPLEVVRNLASEAMLRGAAPGDVARVVLEVCAEEPRQPFGDGDRCHVAMIFEATGIFERREVTLGPDFEFADQRAGGLTLTIRKREDDE